MTLRQNAICWEKSGNTVLLISCPSLYPYHSLLAKSNSAGLAAFEDGVPYRCYRQMRISCCDKVFKYKTDFTYCYSLSVNRSLWGKLHICSTHVILNRRRGRLSSDGFSITTLDLMSHVKLKNC
ncbi:hypothetical protein J6590_049112 [Homalodisca vitripennis]|nr:hypothetical protein J6590_049112 [Homalodisca vitripennis]